jgi:autotransporter-associated beta strand protein
MNAVLAYANMANASFVNANLTSANLSSGTLVNANLSGADLRGASVGYFDVTTIATNTILSNGIIQGLSLNSNNPTLYVRNYSGLNSYAIHIQLGMSMNTGTSLVFEFDGNPWISTVFFESGIPVTLGGDLELDLAAGVNPASLVGDSFQVFNWTGVNPSGQFAIITNDLPSGYSWNTSQLYTTGSVTLVPASGGLWAAAVSGNWSDSTKWTGGVPNSVGQWAVFRTSTTADVTITLDSPETVGGLVLGGSGSTDYTLSGGGTNTLTFNNSGSGATIAVIAGSHAIDAPVVLADNVLVSGSGTLGFGNSSSISGSYSLTMSGAGGTLILSGTDSYTGGTNVTAGTLIVMNNAALADGTSLTVGAEATTIFEQSAVGSPSVVAVPEPSTSVLWGFGAIGLLGWVWQQRQKR